ncbi:MAG: hypothetical protein IPL65_21515 [Lewinellaceae bacterium]|nr:hypothetical protein [Lewinellaceae bacterium]
MKLAYYLIYIALAFYTGLSLAACTKEPAEGFSGTGLRPVYLPVSELSNVGNLPEQALEQTGTIFLQDSLFFILEQKKGIHVYFVKDSLNFDYLTFIKIPAISDFTVSGTRLYADSWKDLLTIDISNILQVKLLNRQTDVFSPLLSPPLYNGIFECVDESRGAVVGWETAELETVSCRTLN